MIPEDALLHMSLWDNIEVIIVVILVILFDLILPIIKKRRAKQAAIPEYEPVEAEAYAAPAPARLESFQAVPAVRAAVPGPAPRRATALGQSDRLRAGFLRLLAPLQGNAEIDAAFSSSHFSGRLEAAMRAAPFPFWLVDGVTVALDQMSREVPALRDQLLEAAYGAMPAGELTRIDELTTHSEKLVAGWAELLLVDALGLTLLGPTWAWLRLTRLEQEGLVDSMDLTVSGSRELLLNPPASVMRPVFLGGLQQLGYVPHVDGFKKATGHIPDQSAQVVLRLRGLGPVVRLPIPAPPLRTYTSSALTAVLFADVDALKSRLVNLCRRKDLPGIYGKSLGLGKVVPVQGLPALLDAGHLLALAELGLSQGSQAVAQAFGVRRTAVRLAPESGGLRGRGFSVSGLAVAEGIVLGEVLKRR